MTRIALCMVVLLAVCGLARAEDSIDVGSRRELFVDDYLIESLTEKAELRLHRPAARELVLEHDAPWEGTGSGYHSVFRDGDLYRMYYKAWHLDLTYVDSPEEHLYTNQIKPYYRAPHLFIGFPTRYVERGWSDSMRELPELERREIRAAASLRYGTALTEGLLMASRDGVHFKRWNEAFLPPGIQREGTWQYGQQYIAWHVVETASALEGAPNELSLYAGENYWTGNSSALRRYTLRIDGFVSARAPFSGGELVTKPITFTGKKLSLNFSTSAAGGIHVELQQPDGQPISGFSLADCQEVFGNELDRTVSWSGGSNLGKLAGKPVRLCFALRDADLFSFQFGE